MNMRTGAEAPLGFLRASMVLVMAIVCALPASVTARQDVVESAVPQHSDLVLADEPLVQIGMMDGPPEYLFGNITGAIRLPDGRIVVADEQSYEIRMYDAAGAHVWTSGQEGEGPGEYGGVRLVRGCPGAAITVYDWHLDRITELDPDGLVVDTRLIGQTGGMPYGDPACAIDGSLVYTPWPDNRQTLDFDPGDNFRWTMSLQKVQGDSSIVLRSDIPGTERTRYGGGSGPRTWGRDLVHAVTPRGAWYGSGDDFELSHVDWSGSVSRIARWGGADLTVTRDHLDRYRDARVGRYSQPEEQRRFLRERWPEIRDQLPKRFPAYTDLLPLADGSVWVSTHGWQSPMRELHLLDATGAWAYRLAIPAASALLDAGQDWVLLRQQGDHGAPVVALYLLVNSTALFPAPNR